MWNETTADLINFFVVDACQVQLAITVVDS